MTCVASCVTGDSDDDQKQVLAKGMAELESSLEPDKKRCAELHKSL